MDDMVLLLETCKSIARTVINDGHRDALLNRIVIVRILSMALERLDELSGERLLSDEEYMYKATNHEFLESVIGQMDLLYKSYGSLVTDEDYSYEERLDILRTSVNIADNLLDGFRARKTYMENLKLKSKHDEILEDLKYKIDAIDLPEKILDLLEKSGNNFLLKLDDVKVIYPVVVDLLSDTFGMEYSYTEDKEVIDRLIEKKLYPHTVELQKLKKSFSMKFYSKLEFRSLVRADRVRIYILHEYSRALKCDVSILRRLYMELLYYDPNNHPNAMRAKMDLSATAPREYMMPFVKMVKKIEYTGIPHAYSDL